MSPLDRQPEGPRGAQALDQEAAPVFIGMDSGCPEGDGTAFVALGAFFLWQALKATAQARGAEPFAVRGFRSGPRLPVVSSGSGAAVGRVMGRAFGTVRFPGDHDRTLAATAGRRIL